MSGDMTMAEVETEIKAICQRLEISYELEHDGIRFYDDKGDLVDLFIEDVEYCDKLDDSKRVILGFLRGVDYGRNHGRDAR